MSEPKHMFDGRCHCGAFAMRLAFTRSAEETQVRSCQCGFCTRHGSLTVSDPAGRAVIEIAAGALTTYRFATATATSLICRTCGVYVAAFMGEPDDSKGLATLMAYALDEGARFPVAEPIVYEGEDAAARRARRHQRWTPATLVVAKG
jgi:hypothetical protein